LLIPQTASLSLLYKSALNDYTSESYLPTAQKLYQWLITPLEDELEALNIDTLIF